MAEIEWDLDVYYWPREAVERWWKEGWDWANLAKKPCPHEDFKGKSYQAYWSPTSEFRNPIVENSAVEVSEEAYWGKRWLSRFAGKEWDPYHLPLFDLKGILSPKHPGYEGPGKWTDEDREALNRGLLVRMCAGERISESRERPEAPDRRAPLSGVVVVKFEVSVRPKRDKVHIVFDNAMFSPGCNFGSVWLADDDEQGNELPEYVLGFGDNSSFIDTTFGRSAYFDNVKFGRSIMFNGARFAGSSYFFGARFERDTQFLRAQFDGVANFLEASFQDIDFSDAWFEIGPTFDDAHFIGEALFANAELGGLAWFRRAQFGQAADFRAATFAYAALFDYCSFEEGATFKGAQFDRGASFEGVRFAGATIFEEAQFLGDASFALGTKAEDGSRKGTAKRSNRAEIDLIDLEVDANAPIEFEINLAREMFPKEERAFHYASFRRAEFWGDVDFENRVFMSETLFSYAQFFSVPEFHGVSLHPNTQFVKTKFCPAPGGIPTPPEERRNANGVATYDKASRKLASKMKKALRRSEEAVSSKDEDRAEAEILRLEADLRSNRAAIRCVREMIAREELERQRHSRRRRYSLRPQLERQRTTRARITGRLESEDRKELKREQQEGEDKTAADFESAFRRLKLLMDAIGSRAEEQRFFAYEIQSRIQRRGDPEVTWWERQFARLYGVTSDFGQSIARPLAGIGLLALCLVPIYGLLAFLAGEGWPLRPVSSYVVRNILPIFLIREQLLMEEGGRFDQWLISVLNTHPILFHVVATGHAVLTLVFWFLFALAIRRRFRIT